MFNQMSFKSVIVHIADKNVNKRKHVVVVRESGFNIPANRHGEELMQWEQ